MQKAPDWNSESTSLSTLEVADWQKDLEAKEAQEHKTRTAVIEMFGTTVESVAHYVNHALSILAMETKQYESLFGSVAPGKRDQVDQAFREMRQEIETIEACVKTMLKFSDLVCTKYNKKQVSCKP